MTGAWDEVVEGLDAAGLDEDGERPVPVDQRHAGAFVQGAFVEYQKDCFLRATLVAEVRRAPQDRCWVFLTTRDGDGLPERAATTLPMHTLLAALNLAITNERGGGWRHLQPEDVR